MKRREPSERYIRFYMPILQVLRELGGSGTPKEVKTKIIERFKFTDEQLAQKTPGGAPQIWIEIGWARNTLRELGLIDGSEQGVWRLTEKGKAANFTVEEARAMRKKWQQERRKLRFTQADAKAEVALETSELDGEDELTEPDLLSVMQNLPPAGFERLCQRLLREAGFSEVIVTGKSGDGGIDGHGILQINELVSFRVLFQCKRYQGAVGPGAIRDFRGAMMGRSDKGIFLTTGTFSRDAEKEAVREGAPPVELVDGEKLTQLMQRLKLGVAPRTVYDVDLKFFDEYQ